MKRLISLLKLSTVLAMTSVVFAQATGDPSNPFRQLDDASALTSIRGLDGIRRDIKERCQKSIENAGDYLLIAELMKRVGDLRANEYYQKAIAVDGTEPAYELFYTDYLRNFRGPGRPLFPDAEKHYRLAQKKLRRIDKQRPWDPITDQRVERGLVALYQEDGLPFVNWHQKDIARPLLFFSSINRFAQLTGDFDNVDDVRAFTSEALLTSSRLKVRRASEVNARTSSTLSKSPVSWAKRLIELKKSRGRAISFWCQLTNGRPSS